jgi:hypothetical protein
MADVSLDFAGGPFALETSKLCDEAKCLLYLSIIAPPASSSSDAVRSRMCSCCRCGDVGHTADACHGPLPDFATLQRQFDDDIQKVVTSITADIEFVRDEFGFFLPGTFLPTDKNHVDGRFCENCGEFGHSAVRCDRPTLSACVAFIEKRTPTADSILEFSDWFRGGGRRRATPRMAGLNAGDGTRTMKPLS